MDLWIADLDRDTVDAPLSPAERERAARFRAPRDAQRWLASRRRLRVLLAARTGDDPGRLRFAVGPSGKPSLPDGPAFSLARSGRWAIYAIGRSAPVGVDAEVLREPVDRGAVLAALAPEEAGELRALPAAQRLRAVLACWTRKEAYLKARGTGLSVDPASFRVTTSPCRPARLLRAAPGDDRRRWWLADAAGPPGLLIAVAGAREPER